MKPLLAGLLALVFLNFIPVRTTISKGERKSAIAYFKQTQKDLAKEIKGLSENQLNWKPADSVWSIANCVEHIALSEKNLNDWAMSTLKEAADPARRNEVKMTDQQVKDILESRERRVKTREGFIPTGQFGNAAQSFDVFKERRAGIIKYLASTSDDLRNHFAQSPLGTVDTYQLFLFIAAHSRRHTAQIIELKNNPAFPKK